MTAVDATRERTQLVGLGRLVLVAIIVTLYFVVLAPFGYAAFALLHMLPSRDPIGRAKMLQGVMRRAFTLMHDTLRALGVLDFNSRSVQGKLPQRPCVLVANHPTLTDITALIASFRNVTTAVKPGIYRRWWLRPLLEDAAQFEGVSSDTLDTTAVIDAAIERLQQGFHVLIFPEGTRSPVNALHPFGRTAFEIACRAQVPVVPIVIRARPRWLSKERGMFNLPPRTPCIQLKALPATPPAHGSGSRKVRDMIYDRVREELARNHE